MTEPDAARRSLSQRLTERMQVEPCAYSSDGHRFGFEAAAASGMSVGSFVVLGTDHADLLAQVEAIELVRRDGTELRVQFAEPIGVHPGIIADSGTLRTDERVLVGTGRVLGELVEGALAARAGRGFVDASLRAATTPEVELLADTAREGVLEVGRLLASDTSAQVVASGFARHTFLVGQSGSGKTYSTGVLLEQLLLGTDLRIVVLDPNSDHVHLNELEGVGPVESLSGASLRMHLRDLDHDLQARLLRLDPLVDRAEYAAFRRLLLEFGDTPVAEMPSADQVEDPVTKALALRVENLGVNEWGVWGRLDPASVLHRLDEDDWRALVVDLGSLATQAERDATAAAVLGRLWDQRSRRRPVLIVIDEAHNVAPAGTEDAVRALATDLAVTIAGEGRKFGLHLVVATQRPAKVHPHVVSQCDNLVLMRLNSSADVEEVAQVFSHVPAGMIRASSGFGLGHALVAGPISPTPQLLRFGARITREGGGDVPTTWAAPRSPA